MAVTCRLDNEKGDSYNSEFQYVDNCHFGLSVIKNMSIEIVSYCIMKQLTYFGLSIGFMAKRSYRDID